MCAGRSDRRYFHLDRTVTITLGVLILLFNEMDEYGGVCLFEITIPIKLPMADELPKVKRWTSKLLDDHTQFDHPEFKVRYNHLYTEADMVWYFEGCSRADSMDITFANVREIWAH